MKRVFVHIIIVIWRVMKEASMEKHVGIILRTYNNNPHKIVLMDNHFGKMVGVFNHAPAHYGAVISYEVRKTTSALFLHNIEVTFLPNDIACNDIVFLHHLLEICYYLVPMGSCTRDVMQLLTTLYQEWPAQATTLFKNTIVFKLLLLVGCQAPEGTSRSVLFHRLMTESIDTIMAIILDLGIENEFSQWLYSCIAAHPHASYFKTLSFYLQD